MYLSNTAGYTDWQWDHCVAYMLIFKLLNQASICFSFILATTAASSLFHHSHIIPTNVKAHYFRKENIQCRIALCVLPRQGTTYSHSLNAPEYESDNTAQNMQNRAGSLGCGKQGLKM